MKTAYQPKVVGDLFVLYHNEQAYMDIVAKKTASYWPKIENFLYICST